MDQFNQDNNLQQNAAQLLQQAQNANLMASVAQQDQQISNNNVMYSNFQNIDTSNLQQNVQINQVMQPDQAMQFVQQQQFVPQMNQIQTQGNNYGQEFAVSNQANFTNDNQVASAQQTQNQQPNNFIEQNINVPQSNQMDIIQHQPNQQEDDQNPEENIQSQKSQEREIYHISANVFQMAQINKMLPKGFKFDVLEQVQKQTELHQKKTAGLANYMVKKPEIQNEKKQQKIIQKYNQKKLKEQEKLQQQQQNIINYCTMREGVQNQEVMPEIEKQNGFYDDLEDIKNKQMMKSQSMMQKKSSTMEKKNKFQKVQQPQNINYQKETAVKTKKLFELHVNNGQNLNENQDFNNVFNIVNQNKPNQFDNKDKQKRGRRPNAVKNYAQLINNSGGEEDDEEFSKNDQSKRARKTKAEMQQQQQNAPINPIQIYQDLNQYDQLEPGTLFDEVDHSQLNIYDKYYKLLESIITHPSLKALQEVPLFFRQPNEQTKFYKEIMKEYSQNGNVLNFNQILVKLKNKKYGPGKNMIKETMIQKDIRSIFQMVDKYYHYDQTSIMIKNQLSQHFEVELAASPNPKFQQFKQNKGDIPVESHQKLKRSKKHFDDTGSDFMDEVQSDGKKNKKDKKDKKKDKKKGKDKKSKDKHNSNEYGNEEGSNKPNEDDEQLAIKTRLYENIMKHLNIEQKKGIIPIVQQQMSLQNHQVLQQQKFEFDLFSLPKATCLSLERYVDECIKANNKGNEQINPNANDNNEDEIQKQIDEKLKEHQMVENDGRQEENQVKIYDLNNQEQIYVGDRHLLIKKISQLDTIQLRGIVPIVKQFQTQDQQTDDQKLEFDLYELPDQKCKELHNYVENCIEGNKVAKEQEEMEKQRMYQMNEIEMQNQDMYQLHMQQQQQQQQQQQYQNQMFNGAENGGDQQQQMLDQQKSQQQQQQQLLNTQQQQQQFNQFNQQDPQQQNQQMQQQNDQGDQQVNLLKSPAEADQENMIMRFKLLESIKQLKDEKLDQLGQVMNTEEFKKIDSLDKGYALTTDKEQALIELDIEALSIKKVQFLQNFIENLMQTTNQEENAAATENQQMQQQQVNNQILGQGQENANKGVQGTGQMEELQKYMEQFEQNQQAQLAQYQQLQVHISQQLEHQIQQYQETTMIINELTTLNQKAESLKQEIPSEHTMQLRQYIQNEQVLQQNIKSLQAYQVEQSTLFEQQKQNSQLEMEQRKLAFQQQMQNGVQELQPKPSDQVQNEENNAIQKSLSQKKDETQEQPRDQGSISNQQVQQQIDQNAISEQQKAQLIQQQQQQDQQISNEPLDKQASVNVPNPQQEEQKLPNENGNGQSQQLGGAQPDLAQKQQQLNQLIYQYQINQNTMEELLQVSQQLQNLYVQHQNKQGQEGVDESLQQIQENLLEHQQHIQNLAATQQLYEHQIIEIQQLLTNAQQPGNDRGQQQNPQQQPQQPEMADQQQLNQVNQIQQQQLEQQQFKQNDQQQQLQPNQENPVEVNNNLSKPADEKPQQQQQSQQATVVQNEDQQNGLELQQQNQQMQQQQAQNQGVVHQQQQQQQQMMGPQLDEHTQQLIQMQMEQIITQQNIQFTSQQEMQQYCLELQQQLIQQHIQNAQNAQNAQTNNQTGLEVKNEDDGQPQANGMTPFNTQIEPPKQEEK